MAELPWHLKCLKSPTGLLRAEFAAYHDAREQPLGVLGLYRYVRLG